MSKHKKINERIDNLYEVLANRLEDVIEDGQTILSEVGKARQTLRMLAPVFEDIHKDIANLFSADGNILAMVGRLDTLFGSHHDRIAKLEEHPLGLDLNEYVTYDELNDREYARGEDVFGSWNGLRSQLSAFQSRLDTMDNNPEYSLKALSEEVSRLRGEIAGLRLRVGDGVPSSDATLLTPDLSGVTLEVNGEEAEFIPNEDIEDVDGPAY